MRILQVSFADVEGGAERVALLLHQQYRALGLEAELAVGIQRTREPGVLRLEQERYRHPWARLCTSAASLLDPLVGKFKGPGRLRHWINEIGQPARSFRRRLGYEDFDCPAAARLLDSRPDVLHAHNLHGGYFDLRQLPALSRRVPFFLTLHDTWTFTGHCAYMLDCPRWEIGCGQCPRLDVYPPIARDKSAENWRLKQRLWADARVYLAAPSQWLMDLAQRSILRNAIVESRVIPYGIDLQVFTPADQAQARAQLAIPQDHRVLLFAANRAQTNPYKDYTTVQNAVGHIARQMPDAPLMLLALGGEAGERREANVLVRSVGFVNDPQQMAQYYRAADLYLHAARADNFPNAVLEALACGTPVVATAVGGVPEQVHHDATGLLVPPGDAAALASSAVGLLSDTPRLRTMAKASADQARERFDLRRQALQYLDWYDSALARRPEVAHVR